MACPCCVPCRLCYARFTSITASKAVGAIAVNAGSVSVTVTGGAIVENPPGVFVPPVQYRSGFFGSAYQWPCDSVPTVANHVALKEESAGSTYQIALSATVNRIVMPIISLGAFFRIGNNPPLVNKTVTWQFSSDLTIISQGAHAEYGQCEDPGNCLQASGNTLVGLEGSGIVNFAGSFSELSLTVASASENFNAFGIGIPCETNPLP